MATIFDAHNLSQAQAAANASVSGNVEIRVRASVTLTNTLTIPQSGNTVTVRPADTASEFNATPLQHPDNPTYVGKNAIEHYCARFIMEGMTLRGFQENGAMVKGNNENAALCRIRNCRFRDIGTRLYPFRIAIPVEAQDTIYTQAIAQHKMYTGHIDVEDNKFERCSTNQFDWAHVIYCDALRMTAHRNTFIDCGSALSCGDHLPPQQQQYRFIGNHVLNPALCRDKYGAFRRAWAWNIHPVCGWECLNNVFFGTFDYLFSGYFDTPRVRFDNNDYRGAIVNQCHAIILDVGNRNFSQWQGLGMDPNALAPLN